MSIMKPSDPAKGLSKRGVRIRVACYFPIASWHRRSESRDHVRKAADLKACVSGHGTMSDMPARYDRPPFLDTIELELKKRHTSAAHKVIHKIGVRVRHHYMESRYTSRAEAERTFRALVEQDETCKSCKIFTVYR